MRGGGGRLRGESVVIYLKAGEESVDVVECVAVVHFVSWVKVAVDSLDAVATSFLFLVMDAVAASFLVLVDLCKRARHRGGIVVVGEDGDKIRRWGTRGGSGRIREVGSVHMRCRRDETWHGDGAGISLCARSEGTGLSTRRPRGFTGTEKLLGRGASNVRRGDGGLNDVGVLSNGMCRRHGEWRWDEKAAVVSSKRIQSCMRRASTLARDSCVCLLLKTSRRSGETTVVRSMKVVVTLPPEVSYCKRRKSV